MIDVKCVSACFFIRFFYRLCQMRGGGGGGGRFLRNALKLSTFVQHWQFCWHIQLYQTYIFCSQNSGTIMASLSKYPCFCNSGGLESVFYFHNIIHRQNSMQYFSNTIVIHQQSVSSDYDTSQLP